MGEYHYKPKTDLTGQKFGRLTVIGLNQEESDKRNRSMYICRCDCGKLKEAIYGYTLNNGSVKSCGCMRNDRIKALNKKYNTYKLFDTYGIGYTDDNEIKCAKDNYGRNFFYFDIEDYNLIKDYYWRFTDSGYVYNNQVKELHRFIMNLDIKDKRVVDHIHGERTRNDNRKQNLRIASFVENCRNVGIRGHNTSGVTGVYYHITNKRWVAYIIVNQKYIHLGSYKQFEDAVKARKEAEYNIFGEYSYDLSQNGGYIY